jgi:hypothetical protein
MISLQRHIIQQSSSLQPGDDDDTAGAQLVLADVCVDAQRNVGLTINLLVCQIAAALYLLRSTAERWSPKPS